MVEVTELVFLLHPFFLSSLLSSVEILKTFYLVVCLSSGVVYASIRLSS